MDSMDKQMTFCAFRFLLSIPEKIQLELPGIGYSSREDIEKNKEREFIRILRELPALTKEDDSIRFFMCSCPKQNCLIFRAQFQKEIPLERNFVTKNVKHQPSCYVVFDCRKNCHVMAVEKNKSRGSKKIRDVILRLLYSRLREKQITLAINEITESQTFWDMYKTLDVRSVSFRISPANMPNLNAGLAEDMAELGKIISARDVVVTANALQDTKLQLDKAVVVNTVDSIEQGAGTYSFLVGSKKHVVHPQKYQRVFNASWKNIFDVILKIFKKITKVDENYNSSHHLFVFWLCNGVRRTLLGN